MSFHRISDANRSAGSRLRTTLNHLGSMSSNLGQLWTYEIAPFLYIGPGGRRPKLTAFPS